MSGLISKAKVCNYIKACVNPYGKPFGGTTYEFGLKIMEYIENSECDKTLEEHDKEIRNKVIEELKDKICSHFADWQYAEDDKWIKDIIELASESVDEIAEQMKEVDNG